MTESVRDSLRAHTLGRSRAPRTLVVEWEGKSFELRQPTRGEYDQIMRAAGAQIIDGKSTLETANLADAQREAVLLLARVPGTGQRIFEEADRKALLEMPHEPGDFVDVLGAAAMKLTYGTAEEAHARGKASPATPVASGSSG